MKLIEKTSELVFLQNYSIVSTWEFHAKIGSWPLLYVRMPQIIYSALKLNMAWLHAICSLRMSSNASLL